MTISGKVTISDFILPIRMGCGEGERATPQQIQIDLEMETDFADIFTSGDLDDGVDYAIVRQIIKKIAAEGEYPLLEDLAKVIFCRIFRDEPRIISAELSIRKLERWTDAKPGIVVRVTRGGWLAASHN